MTSFVKNWVHLVRIRLANYELYAAAPFAQVNRPINLIPLDRCVAEVNHTGLRSTFDDAPVFLLCALAALSMHCRQMWSWQLWSAIATVYRLGPINVTMLHTADCRWVFSISVIGLQNLHLWTRSPVRSAPYSSTWLHMTLFLILQCTLNTVHNEQKR